MIASTVVILVLTGIAAFTDATRHKIYNCLGGDKQPLIDLAQTANLLEGDILLLCSDGLWSVFDENEIADMLHGGIVTDTIPALLDEAEARSLALASAGSLRSMKAISTEPSNRQTRRCKLVIIRWRTAFWIRPPMRRAQPASSKKPPDTFPVYSVPRRLT